MLLEEASIQGNESIVSWRANGKAFRVNDTDEFDRTILRRYFRQSKYKSFLRQLHIYGFNRIVKGKDKGSYYHELFVRHQPNLCMGMVRQKIKGTRRSVSSIKTNPMMSMTISPKAVAQDQVVPSNKPPTALHEKLEDRSSWEHTHDCTWNVCHGHDVRFETTTPTPITIQSPSDCSMKIHHPWECPLGMQSLCVQERASNDADYFMGKRFFHVLAVGDDNDLDDLLGSEDLSSTAFLPCSIAARSA